MYNHADENYKCPFCSLANGTVIEGQDSIADDIFFQNETLTAFISSTGWKGNEGRILIIPNKHFENLYDIDNETLSKINIFSKRVALAIKEIFKCDGVTIRQHNEPASNQSVFHYHLQLIPRYDNDNLYPRHLEKVKIEPDTRKEWADKFKVYFMSKVS